MRKINPFWICGYASVASFSKKKKKFWTHVYVKSILANLQPLPVNFARFEFLVLTISSKHSQEIRQNQN